jgi:hypothetical protein
MSDIDQMTVSGLQQESERLERLLGETETAIGDLRARLGQVRVELQRRLRPSPEPRVSDHALLRYIERVYGVDVDAARSEIMTPAIVTALKSGASAVTVKGIRMVAKEGVIVTVTTDAMKNGGKAKRQRAHEVDNEAA